MVRLTKEEKLTLATRIRDAALSVVQGKGSFQPIQHKGKEIGKILTCNKGSLTIGYSTPFSNLPLGPPPIPDDWSDAKKHQAALLVQEQGDPMPYLLDIYGASGKVFSMCWNEKGEVHVTSFKRGDWERELIDD